jgi:pimeloyl-ACP methyl ester carboxylesterase
VSTPRSLHRSRLIERTDIETPRGIFAALKAEPTGGVSERQPALLVPGYTGSKEDFLAVLESLATAGRRTVVAIDIRGQYETAPADIGAGYALAQLAADLVAVAAVLAEESRQQIDHASDLVAVGAPAGETQQWFDHAADRVHLVGHSFGGIIAREAAIAAPAAFLSLTLLGSGPGAIGGQRAQALRDLLDYVASADGDRAALGARIGELWQTKLRPQAQAEGTPPDIVDFLAERTARTCPIGLTVMARHLLDCPDRSCDLASVAQWPILVCYGENDDAWPPDVQDAMAKRVRAERICIPCAAHSPAVEAPETTSATLTAFWNRAESRR